MLAKTKVMESQGIAMACIIRPNQVPTFSFQSATVCCSLIQLVSVPVDPQVDHVNIVFSDSALVFAPWNDEVYSPRRASHRCYCYYATMLLEWYVHGCQEQLSLDRPVLPLLHLPPSKSSKSSGSKIGEFHDAFDSPFVFRSEKSVKHASCQWLCCVFVQVTTATLGSTHNS